MKQPRYGLMQRAADRFLSERQRQILTLIKESWVRLLVAMGCMMVVAGTTAAAAYLIRPALDGVFINKNARMLALIPVAVVILFSLRGLAMYGQGYLMNYVGQDIIRLFRNRLYGHIQDMPLSFFQQEKTGGLMSRITNDVNIVKTMVSTAVTGFIKDSFTIIGLTGVIFYQIWELAIFALFILPLAFYPIVKIGRRVRRVSTGCQESMSDLNVFLHETLAGTKIVKAFGRESYEKKRFFDKTLTLFDLEMKEMRAKALSSPIMEFLAGIGIAFIIWYGGSRVISGVYTAGTFISFLASVLLLYDPVKKLSKLNAAVQKGLAATDRIFDILERPSDIREISRPVVLPDCSHSVSFENVYFKYDKTAVLKDINLVVKAGEIMALVGMSGGGKSSLVNLIPRFYDVTAGCIKIGDVDIRTASLDSLRRQIAIVTQEPILFNDTIRNNIAYGKPGASFDEIRQAAVSAYAHRFIDAFPQGFDTRIGELGGRLSGGEKQRICIARALLKDAPILILDEATSSLDAEAEIVVQKALQNLMQGRTTFVIAHRLSTIEYAHRIATIVNGCIVEAGTRKELMERRGEYYKLHQMQFSKQLAHCSDPDKDSPGG